MALPRSIHLRPAANVSPRHNGRRLPLLEGAAIMLLRHAMSFEGEGGPLVSGKAFIFGVTGTNNCPNYFGHDMATAEWDTKGLFHSVTP